MLQELPIDSRAWASFVEGAPDVLPFHHPAWATTLSAAYGFRAFALAIASSDGSLVAGVPVVEISHWLGARRWASLPFSDMCPPLVPPHLELELAHELDEARAAAGVVTFDLAGQLAGCVETGAHDRLQHVLTLTDDLDAVERRYRSSTRRNIRTARTHDLVVRDGHQQSDLTDAFYGLQVLTRRRLGLPPQPRRFFRALWRDVVETGLGSVVLVERKGRAVAGAVFLRHRDVVVYKFGASDPTALRLRPNNLLFAEAIARAAASGVRLFHFGRSQVEDEGLRQFKTGWGAVEEALPYSVLGRVRTTSPTPGVVRAVVRRSPRFVARGLGEILYRYAA